MARAVVAVVVLALALAGCGGGQATHMVQKDTPVTKLTAPCTARDQRPRLWAVAVALGHGRGSGLLRCMAERGRPVRRRPRWGRAAAGVREHLPASRLPGRARFFFQAEDGIRDYKVTGVQTCALPI